MRFLIPGLLAEGESDKQFLGPILRRELDALGLEEGFEVGDVRTDTVSTVARSVAVDQTVERLLRECQIVAVHHDHRERGKLEALRSRVAGGTRIVGLVPVRETEAWALVAMYAQGVPGFDTASAPSPLRSVESDPDPKATLRRLYRRGDPVAAFARVAEAVDLSIPSGLPAYATFLQDLTSALKELHFL